MIRWEPLIEITPIYLVTVGENLVAELGQNGIQ